jgi:hypothetical protein
MRSSLENMDYFMLLSGWYAGGEAALTAHFGTSRKQPLKAKWEKVFRGG